MRENLLYFGDRTICNVLRPQFLHPWEYKRIAEASEGVVGALHKIYAALRAGELDCPHLLHLSPAEAALVALPDISARMDAFWLPGPRWIRAISTFWSTMQTAPVVWATGMR